jgi:hypothetical protein
MWVPHHPNANRGRPLAKATAKFTGGGLHHHEFYNSWSTTTIYGRPQQFKLFKIFIFLMVECTGENEDR